MSDQERIEDLSILGPLAGVLRRRWWVIAVVPLIAAACAVFLAQRQPAEYASTAKVLISDQNLSSIVSGVPAPQSDADRALATEIQIADLPEIAQRAELAAGPVDTKVLQAADVSYGPAVDSSGLLSNVVEFTAVAPDAAYAQRLAGAYADAFVDFRGELNTREIRQAREDTGKRIDELRSSGRDSGAVYDGLVASYEQLGTLLTLGGSEARVLSGGDTAKKVGPKPVRNGGAGFILGLIVAVIAALAIDRLDWRVRSHEEIGDTLGLPVLGRLDDPVREAKRAGLITMVRPNDPAAEAFRMLRTNLKFALGAIGAKSILVTSPLEAEGKTSTCCNLGVVCAAAGMNVTVVDLDLRRPRIHTYLGLERSPGVTEVIAGEVPLQAALRDVSQPSGTEGGHMRVLPAGYKVSSPGELAGAEALGRMLAALRESSDLLIVDAPPALAVGDALAMGSFVDAFMVVARVDRADRRALVDLRQELAQSHRPIVGVVLTAALALRKRYAYYEEGADAAPARVAPAAERDEVDLPYPG